MTTAPPACFRRFIAAALLIVPPLLQAASGDLDPAFNPNADNDHYATAIQPDGSMVIGGAFGAIGATVRLNTARVSASGVLDSGFVADGNGINTGVLIQPDGKIILLGGAVTINGVTHRRVARMNPGGGLDSSFNPDVNGSVLGGLLQPDGKIVITGTFTLVNNVTRHNIARLNTDGSVDMGFDPDANDTVRPVSLQQDGKIVVGGTFTTIGGATRNYVARINSDGTLDTTFDPNANDVLRCSAVLPDGRILIGGQFTSVGGLTRGRLALLNTNGTVDSTFAPAIGATIFSIAVQADGKIIVGGLFSSIGATTRNRILRLNADGTLDTGFDPNSNSSVFSLALQSDGKIIAGGHFTTMGSTARGYICRLLNDTATQSVNIPTAARIEWLRGGSSPEAAFVTFDLSTDGGTTWLPLGNGTRSSGGWELLNPNISASGKIRCRAFVPSGYQNASSSLSETVQDFSGLLVPEIAVEQPVGSGLIDGATHSFGSVLVGDSKSLAFTVRNTGSAALTGLALSLQSITGTGFSIAAHPTSPVSGPNGTTTFTLQFAPTSAGSKSAVIHLLSNDADETSFDLTLTGTALIPALDEDGDGLTNQQELNLAALGFDPLISNSTLLTTLRDNGLYRASDVANLVVDKPVIQKDPTTGDVHLTIGMSQSTDLLNWIPLTSYTPTVDVPSGKMDIKITSPGGSGGVQFYRLYGEKP